MSTRLTFRLLRASQPPVLWLTGGDVVEEGSEVGVLVRPRMVPRRPAPATGGPRSRGRGCGEMPPTAEGWRCGSLLYLQLLNIWIMRHPNTMIITWLTSNLVHVKPRSLLQSWPTGDRRRRRRRNSEEGRRWSIRPCAAPAGPQPQGDEAVVGTGWHPKCEIRLRTRRPRTLAAFQCRRQDSRGRPTWRPRTRTGCAWSLRSLHPCTEHTLWVVYSGLPRLITKSTYVNNTRLRIDQVKKRDENPWLWMSHEIWVPNLNTNADSTG